MPHPGDDRKGRPYAIPFFVTMIERGDGTVAVPYIFSAIIPL